MTHRNPIIDAFSRLTERGGLGPITQVADAYEAADLDTRVEFVAELHERAFDFLERHFGMSPGAAADVLEDAAGVVGALEATVSTAPDGRRLGRFTTPEGEAPGGAGELRALEDTVSGLEVEEGLYHDSIEQHGESVAGNVLSGWRDRLAEIRGHLEEARTVITDIGKRAVVDAAIELADDIGQVGDELEATGADVAGEVAGMVTDAAELLEKAAGIGHPHNGEEATEGEGTEPTAEDGTVPTAPDGTELGPPGLGGTDILIEDPRISESAGVPGSGQEPVYEPQPEPAPEPPTGEQPGDVGEDGLTDVAKDTLEKLHGEQPEAEEPGA